jgi:hypothetical protein
MPRGDGAEGRQGDAGIILCAMGDQMTRASSDFRLRGDVFAALHDEQRYAYKKNRAWQARPGL